jgi:hypothetical protein
MDLDALHNTVFRYESDYFAYLGEHHSEVQRFRSAVVKRDLSELRGAWDNLKLRVHILEREAGHTGRPLIMDYYFWYEYDIEELERRAT